MKKTVVRTKRLMILAMMMVMTISADAARPLVACYQRDARMLLFYLVAMNGS